MTLDQLRIFVAVAERQHLTQAAAALALTPSAVSSSIKALEERYGIPLFHRVGRRIELSHEGRAFLSEARRALAYVGAAETALAELGDLQRGSLAIHASQTIASYWLPPLLVRFRQAYPLLGLSTAVGNTESVAQAVLSGAADIGLVEGMVDEPALTLEPIGADQLVIVVAAHHPWVRRQPQAPADLLDAEWIVREPGSGTRSAFETGLQAAGIAASALRVALELPSNEAVLGAVMAGPYASALSELVVAPYLQAGLLARIGFPLPIRRFCLVRHPERHRSRAAAAFEAMMHQH